MRVTAQVGVSVMLFTRMRDMFFRISAGVRGMLAKDFCDFTQSL
jgi:hypothetical protein